MSSRNGAVGSPGVKKEEPKSGREWDSEAPGYERVDDRDLENIDLDIECWNEALERKAARQ